MAANFDQELADGSVLRQDPISGKRRIVSGADFARTRLTRERDAELSMQAGAPPIAKGPPQFGGAAAPQSPSAPAPGRYSSPDRVLNVARAKADGQFDSIRNSFNAANKDRKMDEAGTIMQAAPAQPSAAPTIPAPVAATNPNLPASYDQPMRNIAVAAGPNISTAPAGLPEGSAGYARKGGAYTVRTADGKTQDFADESAARAAFAQPAKPAASVAGAPALPPPPAIPRTDAAPDAASQAWAENSAGRGAYMDAARAPAPALPAAPTFAATVAPVAAPSPELQAVVAAATQAPQPVATPTNTPRAPEFRTGAGRLSDVGAAFTAPFRTIGAALDSARISPEQSAKDSAERKDRIKGKTYRPDMRSAPVTIPASTLNPERDAGSVRPPLFDDDEPGAFPTLPGSVGSSRPRASFA